MFKFPGKNVKKFPKRNANKFPRKPALLFTFAKFTMFMLTVNAGREAQCRKDMPLNNYSASLDIYSHL